MLAKLLIILGLASAGLLFGIMTFISPTDGGAPAILAVFFLSYVITLTALSFILWFLSKVLMRGARLARNTTASGQSMTLKKSYYFSSVIALAPVIIVSLQSVGEVGIYEFGLIVLLVSLGCLYVAKRFA